MLNYIKDFRNIKSAIQNDNDIILVYNDGSSVTKPITEATEQERFILSYTEAMQLLKIEKEILWTIGECTCEPSFNLNIKRKENSEDIIASAFKDIVITGKKLV